MASGEVNHYKVLGVAPSATPAEIRTAYRSLVTKYHPDVNHAPDAERITIQLNAAWKVLNDPLTRAEYDRKLESASAAAAAAAAASSANSSARTSTVYTYAGQQSSQQEQSQPQSWEMLYCERCGAQDMHLRLVTFFRVWSFMFFTQMLPSERLLCRACRSHEAGASAIFSALLGIWGLPWGVPATFQAIVTAARGGRMVPERNLVILWHLALAYVQRGQYNAAATALEACRRLQPAPKIVEFLREVRAAGGRPLPAPRWSQGQTVAVGAFLAAVLLTLGAFSFLGFGRHNVEAVSPLVRGAVSPPSLAELTGCAQGEAYQGCVGTAMREKLLADAAFSSEEREAYRRNAALYEVFAAQGAREGGDQASGKSLRSDAYELLSDLVRTAGSPRIREEARDVLMCFYADSSQTQCANLLR